MKRSRPLSPHLQIYRLPATGLASITHRITGILLVALIVLLQLLLIGLAVSESFYADLTLFLQSLPGRLLLSALVFSLFFHLCHGVRHLIWDTGTGFDRRSLSVHAGITFGGAVLLSMLWIVWGLGV